MLTGFREADAARGPVQEWCSHSLFQRANGLAYGRRGNAQMPRGFTETAQLRNSEEDDEAVQVGAVNC